MTDHLSQLTFDQMLLGDLEAAAAERADRHIQKCGDCRALWHETERDAGTFDREVLPRTSGSAASRRAPQPWNPTGSLWAGGRRRAAAATASLAAAGLMAVVVIGAARSGRRAASPDDADFTAKGGPAFRVFAEREGRVVAVSEGTRLGGGDRVRFVAAPGRYRFLLVASVDGAGRATVYFPYNGGASAPVAPGGEVALPQAIALDGTPGPERIFALFSERPLDGRAVADQLARIGGGGAQSIRRTRRLSVGASFQDSLLIEK